MLNFRMASGLYIAPHQGLGDHILCSGLYRYLAKDYDLCVIPVIKRNYRAVKDLLKDVKNIQLVKFGEWFPTFEPHRDILKKLGFSSLNLGGFGVPNDIPSNFRFDEWFYSQANVPFVERWNSFYYERDEDKEEELFNLFALQDCSYAFVHEDATRNYLIDSSMIKAGLKIIKSDGNLAKKYTPFNYLKIIEGAKEIHCIESSFCAFIESLENETPKFAHRYARPEAKSDRRQEFTYKHNWTIIN
jgi:hypothetical protein